MAEYIKGPHTGEHGKGLGKTQRTTRQYVGSVIISQNEAIRKRIKKEIEYKEIYGSGRYIEEGTLARITEEYLVNPEDLNELDFRSFMYGYIDSANDLLKRACFNIESCSNKKTPDKLMDIIKSKSKKYKNLRMASEELLYNVGLQDANNKLISEEDLPDKVKENPFYQQGREDGLIKHRGR